MRQRGRPRGKTEQQRKAVDAILGGEAVQLERRQCGLDAGGIEGGKRSSLLPEQNRQRDQGGGEQHGVLDDLRQTCRAHAGGNAAHEQHCYAKRDARSGADGEDAHGYGAEPHEHQGESGKGAQDHGEHGERPDARTAKPLAEEIRHCIAAELAKIRRHKERNEEDPPSPAEDQQGSPIPSLAKGAGEPGKGEHRDQANGDRHAVEQSRHEPPRDIEVGDRPPERDGACPGVERQGRQDEELDGERRVPPFLHALPRSRLREARFGGRRKVALLERLLTCATALRAT